MFKLPIDQLANYRLQTLRNSGFNPKTILDIEFLSIMGFNYKFVRYNISSLSN